MSVTIQPRLSPWEYFTLLGAGSKVLITVLLESVFGVFRGSRGAPTYARHIFYSLIRSQSASLSTRQMQALQPSTLETYHVFASKKKFNPRVVKLHDADDTVGCWIGDKDAGTTILYFHGGGYAAYANSAQLELLWNVMTEVKRRGGNVATLVLQYDLAPGGAYPRQLEQATLALGHLTKIEGKRCSQIILCGDSAGGNLTLALLSHIMHPHPDVQRLSAPIDKFRGVILISPWVSFSQTAQSFTSNAYRDVLDNGTLKTWANAFLGGAEPDEYTEPLTAAPEWWSNMPAEKVLITAGEHEALRDDILEFGSKVKDLNHPTVDEVFLGEAECHDAPVIDGLLGKYNGPTAMKVYDFVCELVLTGMRT
ncbi:alpha/beta hydrolase fold protein [Paraphoma chrysanthemicola]|nr:alpha/beta hydrolase fold protein [Paraphoma chrysanthemicola]